MAEAPTATGCCRAAFDSDGNAHDDDCHYRAGLIEGRRQANSAILWNTTCLGCASQLDVRIAGHEEGYNLALRDHGLMAGDDPVELITQWSVRYDDGKVVGTNFTKAGAEQAAAEGWGGEPVELVERSVRMYADGSTWIGPWRKVGRGG